MNIKFLDEVPEYITKLDNELNFPEEHYRDSSWHDDAINLMK